MLSQETIETTFIKKTNIKFDQLISIDNFETTYYTYNNVFFKKNNSNTISYTNLQLGAIYSVNPFNPLKINLFYKDFNTVVILDNRLAEIFRIDFNNIQPYKNISKITTGHDNTTWLFNQDTQQLELFDYKTNATRAKGLPIKSAILDLKSNYNHCFLLTKNYLYTYNYFGSLISKIKNSGYTSIMENNENIILKKQNKLFYLEKNSKIIKPITMQKVLINQFFVVNESLYIYGNESLQEFQLKI